MDIKAIAESWAESVCKSKGWAPGPNAGWRRTTDYDDIDDPRYWERRKAEMERDQREAREYAATPYARRDALRRKAAALRLLDTDMGTDSSLQLRAISEEMAAIDAEIAALQPKPIEWTREETEANRAAWNAHIRAQGSFAPRDTSRVLREAEERFGFKFDTLKDNIRRHNLGPEPVHKNIRMLVPIDKSATPQRITYGVVLEPETEDLQGDVMTAEDIEKAAYDWMERSQTAGHMHSETVGGAKVVESYIAPCDIPVETPEGPETIRKGSWVLGVRWPENIWKRIADGELTGYSVGGTGIRLALEGIDKAGRGRMGGPLAAGPGGECVCPSCGHRESHPTGEPCDDLKCPECGATMAREEPEDVEKAGKWAPGPNAGWRRLDDDVEGHSEQTPAKNRNRFKNVAGQMLLPAELEAKMPALYSQENVDDPVIVAHYFNPAGQGDWYIYEGERDGDDFTMFGWGGVGDPGDYALGYSSLAEMAAVKGPLGIGIERDKFWKPAALSQVRDKHRVTKRDLASLARDTFVAMIRKDKGWAPGPNAGWRRAGERDDESSAKPKSGKGYETSRGPAPYEYETGKPIPWNAEKQPDGAMEYSAGPWTIRQDGDKWALEHEAGDVEYFDSMADAATAAEEVDAAMTAPSRMRTNEEMSQEEIDAWNEEHGHELGPLVWGKNGIQANPYYPKKETAQTAMAKDMRELMNRYDEFRTKWIRSTGAADGYDEWFTQQVLSRKEPQPKAAER